MNSRKTRAVIRLALVLLALLFVSCGSQPTDLRTFLPSDSLVYMETNDLGRLLKGLQDNRPFEQAMKSKTDFSSLSGLQFAVALTGFEASENAVTGENSILNFKPRFVAVGDSHTWNRYTLKFVEETLGNFINDAYGGGVELERADRANGKYFVWKATDGRKVFALVAESRVFFSNDESALERSLAVARGEGDSLAKNESIARLRLDSDAVAVGYISPDGIAQLSNVVGVTSAMEATDDEDGRSFIARVLPEIVRGSIKEITWTTVKTDSGFEDRYSFALSQDAGGVFRETMKPSASDAALAEAIPAEPFAVTRYNFDNPQIAWRSLLLVAGKSTDQTSGNIIVAFADSIFEPYGVSDSESFLSAVGSEIWTVAIDPEGDQSAAIVSVKDSEKLRRAIPEIDWKAAAESRSGVEIRRSADGDLAAATVDGRLIIGDPETVNKCLDARAGQNFTKNAAFPRFKGNTALTVTFGREATDKTVDLLGKKKEESLQFLTNYLTESRFGDRGLERKTSSPFGLVGRILAQIGEQ